MLGFIRTFLIVSGLAIAFGCDNVMANESHQLEQILAGEDKILVLQQLDVLISDKSLNPNQRIAALTANARLYHSNGELGNAIKVLNLAVQYAKTSQLKRAEADTHKLLGVMYYFKGEYPQALDAYQTSMLFYRDFDAPVLRANLYNNIGLVHAAIGDIEQAFNSYQLAESLYSQYGSTQDKIDIHFNIAGLYNRLHRYEIAIKMFQQVIAQRIEINDQQGLALVYGDIGIAYQNAGNYEQAKHYLNKALQYYQKRNDQYSIASQSHNLAELYNQTGQTEQSKQYAQQAIDLGLSSDNQNAYVGGLYSLAIVQYRSKLFDQALDNLKLSTQVARAMSYTEQLNDNFNLMSLVLAAKNDTEQSLKMHLAFKRGQFEQNNKSLAVPLAQHQVLLESELLKQEVRELTQGRKLRQLELDKTNQQRNFMLFTAVLIIFSSFFIYRRNVERKIKQNLSKTVKQRTQELELLMQDLQQANEIKSQFLANMSHEIRTPLTAVIGQAEAIISGDVEEQFISKEVEIILNNSNHLLTLVNEILDLSRIEANKLELELKNHDLHVLLNVLADMFTEQARNKGLAFNIIEQLPRPCLVKIDLVRLKQIMINLCSNAIKFTYNGRVDLSIRVEAGQLFFSVADTGIGLNDSQIERVFDNFSQGDSSISRRFGGSGIGLCLSRQLAIMMDGDISVASEVNQGSVFTFSIPCLGCNCSEVALVAEVASVTKFAPAAEIALLSEVAQLKKQPALQQITGQVLLADDHQDNRRLIERLLRVLGLDVLCAENGREVIELCRQYQPQLILLDIQMPEMDGIEAFKILRKQGFNRPIIALTANAMTHEIEHYLGLGFDYYLSKPIVRQHFVDVVAFYLEQTIETQHGAEMLESVDMSDLAQDFTGSLVSERQALEDHIKSRDFNQIAIVVHRLAGAAAMFGFPNVAAQAAEIELKIKAQQYQQADEVLGMLMTTLVQPS